MAESDTLPPDPNAPPTPAPRAPRAITCEFCDCSLTPAGELKGRLSDKAKQMRNAEDRIETLTDELRDVRAQLAQATTTITTQAAELDNLRSVVAAAQAAPKSSGYRLLDD